MKLVEPKQSVRIKSKYDLVWVTVTVHNVWQLLYIFPLFAFNKIPVKTDEGLSLIKFDLDTMGNGV